MSFLLAKPDQKRQQAQPLPAQVPSASSPVVAAYPCARAINPNVSLASLLASSPNVDARCADELAQNRLQLPDETCAAARGSGLHTLERDGCQPSADFG